MTDFAAKLATERARMNRLLKPDAAEKIEREIETLRSPSVLSRIRKVGERAPAFDLVDIDGRHARSNDLLARGPLVVSFFRGTWCPYCMLELFEYSERYASIRALGAELVAIAPQSAENAEAYYSEHPLAFRVLVDRSGKTSEAFGVSYEVASYMRDIYRGVFGLNLSHIHDDASWRLPIPTQFVIDSSGTIRYVDADPDFRDRADPGKVIAFLERLRTPLEK